MKDSTLNDTYYLNHKSSNARYFTEYTYGVIPSISAVRIGLQAEMSA